MNTPEYDSFAEIYAVWTDTAGSTRANLPFYLDAYAKTDGPVVELGVGDGRIAVQAAARGRAAAVGVGRARQSRFFGVHAVGVRGAGRTVRGAPSRIRRSVRPLHLPIDNGGLDRYNTTLA